MDAIKLGEGYIHFNDTCFPELNTYIKSSNFSSIFILVDENTHQHCLSYFLSHLETETIIEIIEVESGEEMKTIHTCVEVWKTLSELNADRKSVLINLGGGVITDLGGFIACTFRRGISYINVPTTLLAMVDASVGGKTGVDLEHLKNQIGVISNPDRVLIDTSFLKTLPKNQIKSGLAEMLKHGLISDISYWNNFKNLEALSLEDLNLLIHESVCIKKRIVEEDPHENGIRKTLNYGHTLGHAIESYFLNHPEKQTLLHGEAIVVGIVLACYISSKKLGFSEDITHQVKTDLTRFYGKIDITPMEYGKIINLLKYDKKNSHGNINFVLLKSIGVCEIDCIVEEQIIIDAFNFYNS